MSRRHHVLVNLSRLTPGCATDDLSRFLPELVAQRPHTSFVAVTPRAAARVVESWGVEAHTSATTMGALRAGVPVGRIGALRKFRPDAVLGPVDHTLTPTRVPQIVWARHLPPFDGIGDRPDPLRATISRARRRGRTLVIYPTAAARRVGELLGGKQPALVLRPALRDRGAVSSRRVYEGRSILNIVVPWRDQRGPNFGLLTRMSAVLDAGGVAHHIRVTGDLPARLTGSTVSGGHAAGPDLLRDQHVALLPWLGESDCSPLVTLERAGFPVAASAIAGHVELRRDAPLFDPASPHGAADALLAAVARRHSAGDEAHVGDWRWLTPARYAAEISDEIERMSVGAETTWAV